MDLELNFVSIVGKEVGMMLRGKRAHKPENANDIVPKHSLMIDTDLIEHKNVGDTKAPLLCCFLLISKLKAGDIITTGQYMNYQTFSNVQFKPLLKNSFHTIHSEFRDSSRGKIRFVSVEISHLVLMLQKCFSHSILI